MTDVNTRMLGRIDELKLSERIQQWKQAIKSSGWKLFADRERWTMASWHETEGEDIQIRRAKLLKKILDNIEIRIHDYDIIVGRLTPGVIGCATAFDISGDYIPDLWNETAKINITMDASVGLDNESIGILRNSVRVFGGNTAPEMTYKAWEAIVGSWVITAENHQDLIPMVGTIQRDLNGKLRLMLHGTVKDLSLNDPFIYQCNIDATLCPATWTSVGIPVPEDGPATHSSVLAYCENYFEPDNPFTSNVRLVPVPCSTVPNP